jgi:hypothetical protein
MSSRLARLVVLLVAVLGFGCMHARWTVVRQASPNPYPVDASFAVEPLHFEGAVVAGRTEAQYLADKSDDLKNLWESDKQQTAMTYAERVSADAALTAKAIVPGSPPDPKAYIVRATVLNVEPGAFAGVAVQPTEMRIALQVLAPGGGQVIDEIRLRATVPAGSTSPSTGGRMRSAASDLGASTAEYLRSRVPH